MLNSFCVPLLFTVRSDDSNETMCSPESWVPEQFWEPSTKFEQSMLGDAEQQLEGMGG